ncbi:hypothetical protein SteCoe_16377 [Stentor coeruleus]|uniref:Uncharacterized protein n=1 Tax=Stentor coeruleus TaxID=5963 RepID=A0A1R2C1D8_9CILI|nr:hypothetical protein SteCoe_16377 [Stentor coeruleus]
MSSDESSPERNLQDYWEDKIDISPIKPESQPKTDADFFRSLTVNRSSPKKFLFKSITLKGGETLKELQKSIIILRQRNLTQVQQLTQEVKSNTRKELKEAVAEINAGFEKEICTIRLEHDKMKDEISKRNRELILLGKFMVDQESLISQNRLIKILKNEIPNTSQAIVDEKKILKSDLKVLKVRIEGMKEAIVEYTNKTNTADAKMKDLDKEIEKIKAGHRQELKALEVQLEAKLEKAKKERDDVKSAYEIYRKSGWKEIEDKEQSLEKQNMIIVMLQNELKTAKGIIFHQKLQLRIHNSLQGYVEEYENNDEIDMTMQSQNVSNYVVPVPGRSKTICTRKKFIRSNELSFSTNFQSMVSDTGSAFSKTHNRRAAPAGYKPKLSPIS